MSLLAIEKIFNKKDAVSQLILEYKKGNFLNLTASEKEIIHKGIEENVSHARFIASSNYIISGLLHDKDDTIELIKRKGLFRYSKYLETKNIIESLCNKILSLSGDLNLNQNQLKYFKTIKNLSPIYNILDQKRSSIINEIRNFKKLQNKGIKKSLIKTLLVYIDSLFLKNYYPAQKECPQTLNYYSKEKISEAISYIIFLYKDLFGFEEIEKLLIDEGYILSKAIEKIILDACHFKDLREFEIMIDNFSYECISENQNIIIQPFIPDFEKSIKIGYIRTEQTKYYDFHYNFRNLGFTSLENVINKLNEFCKNHTIDLVKHTDSFNSPRYTIEIPEPIYNLLANKFLHPDTLFEEEAQYISYVFKEQFLTLEKLKNFYIRNTLSLFDFLKIKRFFMLLNLLFSKNILEKTKDTPEILFRSIIPALRKDFIYEILSHVTTKDKIADFLDIVTWRPEQREIFDLQYQPFLFSGNYYIIPVNVFVNSNTIRNIFALEYKLNNPQIFDDGRYDPISEKLTKSFKYQEFATHGKTNYSFKNGGDIDFLAYKEDFLFVAECKNSLLPTDIYELRNIYDSLNKANKQLNLILDALKDSNTIKEISDKINYDLKNIKRIQTAVITSTRLFVGSSFWNHPVRSVHEITNFLETGNIEKNDGEYSLWGNDTFTINDLINYLNDNNPFIKLFYESMELRKLEYHFNSFRVSFETYSLNTQKLELNFNNLRLRKIK